MPIRLLCLNHALEAIHNINNIEKDIQIPGFLFDYSTRYSYAEGFCSLACWATDCALGRLSLPAIRSVSACSPAAQDPSWAGAESSVALDIS